MQVPWCCFTSQVAPKIRRQMGCDTVHIMAVRPRVSAPSRRAVGAATRNSVRCTQLFATECYVRLLQSNPQNSDEVGDAGESRRLHSVCPDASSSRRSLGTARQRSAVQKRTWIVAVAAVSITPAVRVLNGAERSVRSRCCVMTTCLTPSSAAATRSVGVDTYRKFVLCSPLSCCRSRSPRDAGKTEKRVSITTVTRDNSTRPNACPKTSLYKMVICTCATPCVTKTLSLL